MSQEQEEIRCEINFFFSIVYYVNKCPQMACTSFNFGQDNAMHVILNSCPALEIACGWFTRFFKSAICFSPPSFPLFIISFFVCVCVLSCVNWNTNSLHTHTQRNPPLPIHYHRFYSLAGRRYINASVISPCLNIFHFLFTTSKLSSQNCLRTLVVICAPLSHCNCAHHRQRCVSKRRIIIGKT